MKVYYINSNDYNYGNKKESPLFNSKEKAIKHLTEVIIPPLSKIADFERHVVKRDAQVTVRGNLYNVRINQLTYDKQYNSYHEEPNRFSYMFEIIEEQVL